MRARLGGRLCTACAQYWGKSNLARREDDCAPAYNSPEGVGIHMGEAIFALIGVLVGAIVTGGVSHYFWTREQKIRDDRASKERTQRIAEQLRHTGGELIELARTPLLGSHVDQTGQTTATYLETLRLKRELVNVIASVREASPQQQERLKIFEQQLNGAVFMNPSKERWTNYDLNSTVFWQSL